MHVPGFVREGLKAFCDKQMTVGKDFARPLQAASRPPRGAKLQRVGDREQEARGARRIVGRAVAEREGDAEIGLEIVPEEEADAAAGRGQREAIADIVAVVPDRAGVDEAVKLIAREVAEIRPLVEAQLEGTGKAVVATDLGRAVAAPERCAAE